MRFEDNDLVQDNKALSDKASGKVSHQSRSKQNSQHSQTQSQKGKQIQEHFNTDSKLSNRTITSSSSSESSNKSESNEVEEAKEDIIRSNGKSNISNYSNLRRNTLYFNSQNTPLNKEDSSHPFIFIQNRLNNISKLDDRFEKYKTWTIHRLEQELALYNTILFYLGIIIALVDVAVVTILYYEHFEYLKKWEITDAGQIFRIVCLIASIITAIGVAAKHALMSKVDILKYLLAYNSYIANESKVAITLEIVVHLLQPYPYTEYEW
eukprot:CAMPEP_0170538336 /NCGR_PEP_ID=MMETSP0209-20121228/103247_1 /TAXON_ID=665100 ORGANISM="Litonotus pictus, Strain P1" /NCGR_SAMPLE_ID=MMETSP0209 /ASSEMBLY_ACC=CAM_ASM_000301 /LENGTH=265 /DNA_ID=CAMNT_0010839997 /DNA_START=223 /DNA_END=1017 /DNA_ORIENTATION=+